MENFPQRDPREDQREQYNHPQVADSEKFFKELEDLLKARQTRELVGTFQAGTIPIILDILARDTSDGGRKIVNELFKQIELLKEYYDKRESSAKPEKVDEPKEELVNVPVEKPE